MFFTNVLLSIGLVGVPVDTLETVVVTADKGGVVSKTDTMFIHSGETVRDVLQGFSSLQVSDNGGGAGLKTVSFRGLGSASTSIYVDGLKVGNLQSGQSDLGMLGMNGFSAAVADYAQNAVYFTTAKPEMEKKVGGKVGFAGGSFGTYRPEGRIDWKMGEKVVASVMANGEFSEGDYKYAKGSPRRVNNDIKKGQFGTDLWGGMKDGSWHAKAYANISDRGVPGSVFYPSEDRQKDRNMFVQGSVNNRFSGLYELNAGVKVASDHLGYESSWGDNYYDQTELQANTSHIFRIAKWFTLSATVGVQVDNLESDNYTAKRTALNGVLTAGFRANRFKANLTADYLGAFDKDGENRGVVSPSVDLRVGIAKGLDFVAFGRRAYRMPTFNELYYVGFGNPELKCEDAWMSDFGFEFDRTIGFWRVRANANGFYNYLNNKITSAPTPEDPNVWAPYNIGEVQSSGFDLGGGFEFRNGKVATGLSAKYTMMDARDKTPDSYTFDEQIPFVAKHCFSARADVSYDGWGLAAIYNVRGKRNDTMNEIDGWKTLDMRAEKCFREHYTIFLSAKNITNQRYEIASGYPMPGYSIEAGFNLCF